MYTFNYKFKYIVVVVYAHYFLIDFFFLKNYFYVFFRLSYNLFFLHCCLHFVALLMCVYVFCCCEFRNEFPRLFFLVSKKERNTCVNWIQLSTEKKCFVFIFILILFTTTMFNKEFSFKICVCFLSRKCTLIMLQITKSLQ